jgi:hypothetical protein
MQNTSRCTEIDQRFPGLIAAIVNAHQIQSRDKLQSSNKNSRKTGKRSTKAR